MLLAVAILLFLAEPDPWSAAQQVPSGTGTEVGTVTTIAGPGFCPSIGRPDASTAAVGSLAVDHDGNVFFETGPPGQGLVAMVGSGGGAQLVATGLAARREPGRDGRSDSDGERGSPGDLAPDQEGGVLVAGATSITRADPTSVSTLAGASSDQLGDAVGASGDGGLSGEARFSHILSLTTDVGGNVFVADQLERDGGIRIRFINRSPAPVTLYGGTRWERTIGPGLIDTIAHSGAPLGDEATVAFDTKMAGDAPLLAVGGDRLYVVASQPDSRSGGASEVQVINIGPTPLFVQGQEVAGGNVAVLTAPGPAGAQGKGSGPGFPPTTGIAADVEGRLYMADPSENRVLRMEIDGQVATVAGTGARGFDGTDVPATETRFNRPVDVAVGGQGLVYIADQLNGRVRMVDRGGVVRAVPGAGVGRSTTCADTGAPLDPAVLPSPGGPSDLALGGQGEVFVALTDSHLVQRVNPSGQVTTVAGSAAAGCRAGPVSACRESGGDGGPADEATLDRPTAIASSSVGGLYVLDSGNNRVRFVNLGASPVSLHGVEIGPGAIETVAGDGTSGAGGDGGPARQAQLGSLTLGTFGSLTFANLGILAEQGFGTNAAREGKFSVGSLAIDAAGNLFVGDEANQRVRRVDASGVITTVAGDGAQGQAATCCRQPRGLEVDAAGTLYVADGETAQVWALNLGDQPSVAFGVPLPAGDAEPVVGGGGGVEGGSALEVRLLIPVGLALDRAGNLFVTDVAAPPEGGAVFKVDPNGGLTRLMGSGQRAFNGDGLKAQVTALNLPTAVSVDDLGNLPVADPGQDRVRQLVVARPANAVAPVEAEGRRSPGTLVGLAAVTLLAVVVLVRRARRRRRVPSR